MAGFGQALGSCRSAVSHLPSPGEEQQHSSAAEVNRGQAALGILDKHSILSILPILPALVLVPSLQLQKQPLKNLLT